MFLSTYSSFSVIFVAQQTRNRFQRRLQRHEGDLERLCHNKRKNVKDSSTEAAHLLWTADLFLPVCCSRAHTCSGRCALQTAALLHDAAHKHTNTQTRARLVCWYCLKPDIKDICILTFSSADVTDGSGGGLSVWSLTPWATIWTEVAPSVSGQLLAW